MLNVAVQTISKNPTQNADSSAKLTAYTLLLFVYSCLWKSQSYPNMDLSYHEVYKN